MSGYLRDIVNDFGSYFTDPDRRTFYIHLISAFFIALVYLRFFYKKNVSFPETVKLYLFNKDHWISKSAWLDYTLIFVNVLVRVFLVYPYLMTGTMLTYKISRWLMVNYDIPPISQIPSVYIVLAYTFTIWIVADFSRFLLHYICHKVPFLWEFHKVHHSATVLNPFTEYRQHPLEMFLFYIRGILVFAVVTGIFHYYFSYQLGVLEIMGVNIGRFIFYSFASNLRHSHVPMSFGKHLEHIFISPLQHQVHHSKAKEDYDKNMGSQLAVWDWMFGTLKVSDPQKKLEFGLNGNEDIVSNPIKAILVPFKKMFRPN